MATLNNGAAMANVSFALSQGLSTEEILNATGVSCSDLLDPLVRPPENTMPNILALLAKKFPGEPFALEMARATPFSYFGGLADGAQFAINLRESIELFTKNSSIIADQLELSFDESADVPKLISRHPMDHIDNGRSHEIGIGMVSRLCEEFLGVEDCLVRVSFMHEPNCDVIHYSNFFGVPVDFGASEMALYFKRESLIVGIKQSNVNLFNYVKTHFSIAQKQAKRSKAPNELMRLHKAAEDNMAAGIFSTKAVAAAANMSLRTAQRISSENGSSVLKIIENVREERAKDLLLDKQNDLSAIAFSLGYSDERAFRRAFRRWTGQSPTDFRNNHK
ncbi:MAG: transcriptional regulator [Nitrospirales bacterium]|nr:MAG: transcriptional regulator [Nitrospirales bacterium]